MMTRFNLKFLTFIILFLFLGFSNSVKASELKIEKLTPEIKTRGAGGPVTRKIKISRSFETLGKVKKFKISNKARNTKISLSDNIKEEKIFLRGLATARKYVYKKTSPSVVYIDSVIEKENGEFKAIAYGSGSIIKQKGKFFGILTNWHVVDKAEYFAICLKPRPTKKVCEEFWYEGFIVAQDKKRDLALMYMVSDGKKKFDLIKLSSMHAIEIGDNAHAIGHPEGETWTYSYGYISQIRLKDKWVYDDNFEHEATLLQTATNTSSGSSGGPLMNDKGELIGVNNMGSPTKEFINFAIAVDEVKAFLKESEPKWNQLKEKKKIKNLINIPNSDPIDQNENGVADGYKIDKNNDGRAEKIYVDENEDGTIDGELNDTNNNGIWDEYILDEDFNGVADTYGIDEDEDGKIDRIGKDFNEDGTIDKWETI